MAARTPFEAYHAYQDGLNEALSCVSAGRLIVPSGSVSTPDFQYSMVLNRGEAVTDLRGDHALSLRVLQHFVIQQLSEEAPASYEVQTSEYVYQFTTRTGEVLLAYHWTPEANERVYRAWPHLHVGSVSISDDAPIPNFAKLHIPTGRISLSSVIRLLIEELGVRPRRDTWREVLTTGEDAFVHDRTR